MGALLNQEDWRRVAVCRQETTEVLLYGSYFINLLPMKINGIH